MTTALPAQTFKTLFSFDGCSAPKTACTDGAQPDAGLVQTTNGNFYGTTSGGGVDGDGTIFSLSVGLGPFVETRPASGKVGEVVEILGTNLTGATGVSFNGTPAAITFFSTSVISTTYQPARPAATSR